MAHDAYTSIRSYYIASLASALPSLRCCYCHRLTHLNHFLPLPLGRPCRLPARSFCATTTGDTRQWPSASDEGHRPADGMPDDASYLLCTEDAAAAFFDAAAGGCTGDGEEEEDDECCSVGEEESASIAELIGGEAEHSPRSDYPDRLRSRSIDPAARAESVAWILKVREYYGFLPLTAYLAVSYMDRFLSLHRLPEDGWAMQLLAVTCLSLAAKMEETLVPSLLDLQVDDGTSYFFDPQTIIRMELLVLTALNWRLRSVTPFTFVDFFACKVDPGGRHARRLTARATQVILSAMHDIEFLHHCTSSMAAAAVLCALGDTPSLKPVGPGAAVSWCIGLAEEGISSCYQRMQQLVIGDVQRSLNLCCSDEALSSARSSSSSPPPPKRRKRSPDSPPGT